MGLAMSLVMLSNDVQLDRLTMWYQYRGSLLCVYGLVAFFLGFLWTGSPYYDSWCVHSSAACRTRRAHPR